MSAHIFKPRDHWRGPFTVFRQFLLMLALALIMSSLPPSFLSIDIAVGKEIAADIDAPNSIVDNTLKTAVDSVSNVVESIVTRGWNTILDSPGNQKLIEENIKHLAKKILAICAAFEEVSILLHSPDRAKLKTISGAEIGRLGPR